MNNHRACAFFFALIVMIIPNVNVAGSMPITSRETTPQSFGQSKLSRIFSQLKTGIAGNMFINEALRGFSAQMIAGMIGYYLLTIFAERPPAQDQRREQQVLEILRNAARVLDEFTRALLRRASPAAANQYIEATEATLVRLNQLRAQPNPMTLQETRTLRAAMQKELATVQSAAIELAHAIQQERGYQPAPLATRTQALRQR